MAFSASARDSMVAEMNITPLVDVMLVLLVIFMVSAPLVSQPIQASLPQSTPPTAVRPPSLRLTVGDDGSYRLDGRLLTSAELWQRLDDALISDPRTTLRVSATSNADYQRVVTALSGARRRGIVDIAVQP
jgi:biopolymer transport protein ExbD